MEEAISEKAIGKEIAHALKRNTFSDNNLLRVSDDDASATTDPGAAFIADSKASHGGAAAQDALVHTVAGNGKERLSVAERLKLMKEREKTKKEEEKAEATQAPKRKSMSIADKIAKMQGSGSAEAPSPPPVERSKISPKTGGGIAERLAKLKAGAGGGVGAPSDSPPSVRGHSGSGTASRPTTVMGGAGSTGGGSATHGGGAHIVLPGAFDPPLPPPRCL